MMRIRAYTEGDLDALRRLHATQNFGYPFPADLDDPIFLTRLVLEDDAKRVAMASLVRLTSEVYLLHDPRAGTPLERLKQLLALHRATEQDAYQRGLTDAHAFLPPRVARSFGRRLRRLGWVPEPWTPYWKKLAAY